MSGQVSLSQPASTFGGRKRLKTVLIVMMLLSPLLWLFILVETKKLFKARNEIYCSDAPIEKEGNILKLLFDCGASRFSYCGCYHKSIN